MQRKLRGSANRLFVDSTVSVPIPKIRRQSLPPALLRHLLDLSDPAKSREPTRFVCRLARHGTRGAEREIRLPGNDSLRRRRIRKDVLNREASSDRKGSLFILPALCRFDSRSNFLTFLYFLCSEPILYTMSCTIDLAVIARGSSTRED